MAEKRPEAWLTRVVATGHGLVTDVHAAGGARRRIPADGAPPAEGIDPARYTALSAPPRPHRDPGRPWLRVTPSRRQLRSRWPASPMLDSVVADLAAKLPVSCRRCAGPGRVRLHNCRMRRSSFFAMLLCASVCSPVDFHQRIRRAAIALRLSALRTIVRVIRVLLSADGRHPRLHAAARPPRDRRVGAEGLVGPLHRREPRARDPRTISSGPRWCSSAACMRAAAADARTSCAAPMPGPHRGSGRLVCVGLSEYYPTSTISMSAKWATPPTSCSARLEQRRHPAGAPDRF